MRLIILIVTFYLCYRALKPWMTPHILTQKTNAGSQPEAIEDIMVKDPSCGAYFPKRNGVALRIGGEELLFCSAECKDRYQAGHSKD